MKTCFKCGESKPLDEFYRHKRMADGHLNKCKDCTRTDVAVNYKKNIDKFIEYERERFKRAERKEQRRKYQSEMRAVHPEKGRAYKAVANAIRSGTLVKKPCQVCGSVKVEAHHHDYSKPLDVQWLCRRHHLEAHGKQSWMQ